MLKYIPCWEVNLSATENPLIYLRKGHKTKGPIDLAYIFNALESNPNDLVVSHIKWNELGYGSSKNCYATFRQAAISHGYSKSIKVIQHGEDTYLVKDTKHILRL